jgi:hypothetical protein
MGDKYPEFQTVFQNPKTASTTIEESCRCQKKDTRQENGRRMAFKI